MRILSKKQTKFYKPLCSFDNCTIKGEPANRRNCQRFTGELGKTEVSEKSG